MDGKSERGTRVSTVSRASAPTAGSPLPGTQRSCDTAGLGLMGCRLRWGTAVGSYQLHSPNTHTHTQPISTHTLTHSVPPPHTHIHTHTHTQAQPPSGPTQAGHRAVGASPKALGPASEEAPSAGIRSSCSADRAARPFNAHKTQAVTGG